MAVTSSSFKAKFAEFETVADSQVTAVLTEAAGSLNADLYGDRYDEAHSWLTAHKLAISPFGRSARLSADNGVTTYWKEFARIRREVSPRFIVT